MPVRCRSNHMTTRSQHPGFAAPRSFLGMAASALASNRALAVSLLFVMTTVIVSAVNPSFLTGTNFRDLIVQSVPVIIVACGMTLVVLTGEIDISVGSLFGTLAALLGVLSSPSHMGLPAAAVIALVLLAGLLAGLMNGLLVAVMRVPSIVATLGMLTVFRGVTELIMAGAWITDLPASIRALGTGAVAGVPLSVLVAAGVVLFTVMLTRRTRLGIRIYAVGGNAEAASFARVSPRRIRIFAFGFTGFLTALAALVSVPQQSTIESGIGSGLELVAVTAVLVGGTSIHGGRGGIVGTVLAALLLGSVRTALVFLNLGDMATYWERAIQGAFILGAVLIDHFSAAAGRATNRFAGAPA